MSKSKQIYSNCLESNKYLLDMTFKSFYESSAYSTQELVGNIRDIEDQLKDPCPIRVKEYGGHGKYMSMLKSKLISYKNMLKSS